MAEEQSVLDRWFLKQEIIDQLLAHGEEREDAEQFGQRIATIAGTEEAEHQSLHDPFDRSVALIPMDRWAQEDPLGSKFHKIFLTPKCY